MRRYSAYDPPEYVDWTPPPDLVERWNRILAHVPNRHPLLAEDD